jgi:hypothetical protein
MRTIVINGKGDARRPKENTMTTATATTDELTRIALEGHSAVTAAVTAWVELAERYAKNFDAKHPVPAAADIDAAVDTAFDLAAKLLAGQRAAATSVVAASKQATEAFVDRAQTLASFPTPGAAV